MKKIVLIITAICISLSGIYISGCKNLQTGTSSYYISCSLSDDMVLSGTETVTCYNSSENVVKELSFNLYGNAFRKDAKYKPISAQYYSNAYPNGINYGSMTIDGARVSEKDAKFTICGEDKNVVTIDLEREVFPDETVTVSLDFSLNLADVVARTGYNEKTINLGNFYPILCVYEDGKFYECVYHHNGDPFYSECSNYVVDFSVSDEYKVASAGKTLKKIQKDGISTYTFSLDNARSFSMVLSKYFSVKTENKNGVEVGYYYYDDNNPDQSFDYILKSLDFFGEKFGKYAYSSYSVVQTKFVQGGMEYPTLVMISDNLDEKSYGEVIVHETAHQWWQSAVGNNEIKYGFLDEGLAEYSVVLFYENFKEYGMTREFMVTSAEESYRTYCTVYDKLFGKVNTKMLRDLNEFDSEYEYVNIAYIKSCIMYDYLRKTIGDNRFFLALKKYYSDYCFKIATPYDLVGAFEKTGADTNGFFESFFLGKVIL